MRLILTLFFLTLATPALAVDGVLEISQTCAVQTGCIDNSGGIGDTPGFPVNIEIPGSYVLTSNLTVSDPNTDGLFIATAPVTIDLNGFEIQGPVNCIGLGSALTCDAGTGRGVRSSFVRSTVVNGSVIKFGSDGIQLGGRSRVERVVVEQNGGNGVKTGSDSVVMGSRAYRNGLSGFDLGDSSIVSACTSASNASNGFQGGEGVSIAGASARDNGADGVSAGRNASISRTTASRNEDNGIDVDQGAILSANTVNENQGNGILARNASTVAGNTALLNGANGIRASTGSNVIDNTAAGNGTGGAGFGANLTINVAYRGNSFTDNVSGGVFGGENLGENYCHGDFVTSSACP